MKKIFTFLILVAALLSTPRLAAAHAIPMACLPRMGITVTQPPAQILCQFNEPMFPDKISLQVFDGNGNRVDKNDTRFFENDDHTLVVSLDTAKMANGIYSVNWRVTDTLDMGETMGTFQFGINTIVPPTPTAILPGVAMTPTPVQPTNNAATDLIARFLIGIGVVVLGAVGFLFWRMRASTRESGEQESGTSNQ